MLPGLLKFVNMKSRRLPAASGSVQVSRRRRMRSSSGAGYSRWVDDLPATIFYDDADVAAPLPQAANGPPCLLTGSLPRRVRMFTFAHSDYNSHSVYSYSYFRERLSLARRILSQLVSTIGSRDTICDQRDRDSETVVRNVRTLSYALITTLVAGDKR